MDCSTGGAFAPCVTKVGALDVGQLDAAIEEYFPPRQDLDLSSPNGIAAHVVRKVSKYHGGPKIIALYNAGRSQTYRYSARTSPGVQWISASHGPSRCPNSKCPHCT